MPRMQRTRHVALWLRMLAESEISFGRDSKKLLSSQGARAKDAYKAHGSIAAVVESIQTGRLNWKKLLVGHYAIVIKKFATYTNETVFGASKSQKQNFMQRIQSYISAQGLEKSKYITDTTIDQARKIINAGVENGDGEADIADALEEGIGGEVSDFRARTIARTEVHNAATYAMQETAEEGRDQTGLTVTKEWVAVEDERTRPAHAEADGQEVSIDDTFDVDDESLDRPGDSNGSAANTINCRCTLLYHTADGSETDNPDGDDGGDDVGAGGFIDA